MKRIILTVIAALALVGCEKRPLTPEAKAIAASRILIGALATNASVRVIWNSIAVREHLKNIQDKKTRETLIAEWQAALKDIPVEGLHPSDRCTAVQEACNVLTVDSLVAMRDAGFPYEARWEVRFDVIKWLDRQIAAMKPEVPATDCKPSWRKEAMKWEAYIGVAEWRETEIENLERFGFGTSKNPDDIKKRGAIREKFEKLIGRPVRKSEEIARLGFYAKQVRARLEKERDAALENATSFGGDNEKRKSPII